MKTRSKQRASEVGLYMFKPFQFRFFLQTDSAEYRFAEKQVIKSTLSKNNIRKEGN